MPYNLLCSKCGKEMSCVKNGVNVALGGARLDRSSGVCRADLYICGGCGAEILTGFGASWSAPIPNKKLVERVSYFPRINKWYNKPC